MQERIPIYLAAIGPKNTALAGEIADGWIPTLFSPEHVAEFRGHLEEGAARAGRSLDGFDVAPTVNVFVTDDRAAARDAMRPYLALYVGGMGSRRANFYNRLVQRYGFEEAAATVQDLYLDGKREEAMAALPDELIDLVSLCGPADVVRERLGGLPRGRRRHADGLADGVDGRGAARAAAARRRAGGGVAVGDGRRAGAGERSSSSSQSASGSSSSSSSASTTRGSSWAPATRRSSARAASGGRGGRHGRSEVIAT